MTYSTSARAAGSILLAACFATLCVPSSAQGLYLGPDPQRPRPPDVVRPPVPPRPGPAHIRMASLRLRVEVQDGVATTSLHQVFRNTGGAVGEGTWILPLAPGAAADRFTMTVNGKEVAAEVLDRDKARRIYESIVRRQRDPGLLEYLGHGCLRARIFPIPPGGDVAVQVRFRQVLPATSGIHEWRFPLRAARVGLRGAERVSLDLRIRSSKAIKNVYSPFPGVDVVRRGDHEARVSFESQGGQIPERDLQVFYGLADGEFGLSLLAYRKPGGPGWFLMLLAPKQEWPEPRNTSRVVQFVLDTSGSMQGKKIEQARKALRFFVRSLSSRDLFNVVPFATEARPFFPAPVPASEENVARAFEKIAEIEARGGTNIEDGLRRALEADLPPLPENRTRLPITVFLTDGLPTVGTTDVNALLRLVRKANRHRARVFVFGVGHDVNTRLLDRIAEDSRGDRDYVREDEDLELKTAALFTKLSHPVMTDVRIVCDGIDGFDLLPKTTPDLFKGSRLLVTGRYRGSGNHAIRVRGRVDGAEKEFVFEATFPAEAREHDFVPTLWAQRKVAWLLEQIRLHGRSKELVDEVVRLGKEYGIVTPFTSHLIVEEGMRLARARGLPAGAGGDGFFLGADADGVRRDLARAGGAPPLPDEELRRIARKSREVAARGRRRFEELDDLEAGKKAVEQSVQLRAAARTAGPATPAAGLVGRTGRVLCRRLADKTFYLAGGVWVDAEYRAEMRDRIRRLRAFSKEYFEWLRRHPAAARYLAFSSRVLVVLGDEVVQVVE